MLAILGLIYLTVGFIFAQVMAIFAPTIRERILHHLVDYMSENRPDLQNDIGPIQFDVSCMLMWPLVFILAMGVSIEPPKE